VSHLLGSSLESIRKAARALPRFRYADSSNIWGSPSNRPPTTIATGGLAEFRDRPAALVLDPATDGEGREHAGQVGLDGVAPAVEDRAGLQIASGHPERLLNVP
jgi:hypothetical protein